MAESVPVLRLPVRAFGWFEGLLLSVLNIRNKSEFVNAFLVILPKAFKVSQNRRLSAVLQRLSRQLLHPWLTTQGWNRRVRE